MKTNYYAIKIVVCLAIIFFSCKKEIVYQWPKGTISGRVSFVTPEEITDKSGVLITLEGSSPLLTATSDQNGQFIFSNVETGIYDIVYSKEGFKTYRYSGYQFIGGGDTAYVSTTFLYKATSTYRSNVSLPGSLLKLNQ